jgi:hypothetical protein
MELSALFDPDSGKIVYAEVEEKFIDVLAKFVVAPHDKLVSFAGNETYPDDGSPVNIATEMPLSMFQERSVLHLGFFHIKFFVSNRTIRV